MVPQGRASPRWPPGCSVGETATISDPTIQPQERWLGPGVASIGTTSFLADVSHEIPTDLLPNLLTATLGARPPLSA